MIIALRSIYYIALVGLAIGATMPLLTPYSSLADQVTYFHLFTQAGLLALVILSFLIGSRVRLLICLIFLVIATFPSVRLMPGTAQNDGAAYATANSQKPISLLSFNIEIGAVSVDNLANKLSREMPDIVALQEVIIEVKDGLKQKATTHPYRASDFIRHPSGIEVLSRWPIDRVTTISFGQGPPDSLLKNFALKVHFAPRPNDPQWIGDLVLFAIHAPTPRHQGGWARRNLYLSRLAQAINSESSKYIVIAGDSNAAPWSHHYARFLSDTGLKATQNPFLPHATRYLKELHAPEWFGSPIDHILISDTIKAGDITTGPSLGSDHRPIMLNINAVQAD